MDPVMDLTLSQIIPVTALKSPTCMTITYIGQLSTFTPDKRLLAFKFFRLILNV